jgi:hypothetical protein
MLVAEPGVHVDAALSRAGDTVGLVAEQPELLLYIRARVGMLPAP